MGNSARSHSSFGVPAQSSGKLREDAAVTDVKGMCGSGYKKKKGGKRVQEEKKGRRAETKKPQKNRDRNKVYVSGWPPR